MSNEVNIFAIFLNICYATMINGSEILNKKNFPFKILKKY